jgi:hypothetical protein
MIIGGCVHQLFAAKWSAPHREKISLGTIHRMQQTALQKAQRRKRGSRRKTRAFHSSFHANSRSYLKSSHFLLETGHWGTQGKNRSPRLVAKREESKPKQIKISVSGNGK